MITTCLVIRIQPDEGMSLRIHAKVPGTSFRIEPVKMDFHYGTSFGKASPESLRTIAPRCHERRCHALCARDEVEQAWAFIDPIEQAWHAKKDAPDCSFTPPDRGDRKQRMNCSPVTVGRGGDCNRCLLSLKRSRSGLPVEVGKIDHELKKLWQENEGATRASLINLAVYSEDAGSSQQKYAVHRENH